MAINRLPQRVGRHFLIATEIAIEIGGIAQVNVVGIQLIGLAAETADRLQSEHELRLGLYPAAVDLFGGRSLRRKLGDFLDNHRFELGQRVARCGGRGNLEEAGDLARVLTGRDIGGNPLIEHQAAIQPGGFAVGEHVGGEIEIGVILTEHRDAVPRQIETRQLDSIFPQQPGLAGQHRFIGSDRCHPGTGGQIAEVVAGQRVGLFGVDVAGQRQRGIGGMVIGAEEPPHFIGFGGIEVGNLTDRGPVIRMIGRIQRRQHHHRRQTVGTVFIVLPPLVEHDIALIRELGIGEGGQQEPHAIGFHPQRQFEGVRRHDLPVIGAVGIGRPVQRRAGALERLEISVIVVLGTFEHQMLEEVREPGAARLFVLGPDVIPDVDGHDRAGVIFVQQHVEAVVERLFDERNVHGTGVNGIIGRV